MITDNPPLPGASWEQERRKEAALRKRLLSGRWVEDLQEEIGYHFDARIATHVGIASPTRARNVAKLVADQIAVRYNRPVSVNNADAGQAAEEALAEALTLSGAWQMGRALERQVVLIREGVREVRVNDAGEIETEVVPPSHVYLEANDGAPDVPVLYVRAVYREVSEGGKPVRRWTWDEWDIRDPSAPTFRTLLPNASDDGKTRDITAEVHGVASPDALSGEAYPARYADGSPFLPAILYHAERHGGLWDPWTGTEIVDGTLKVGVLWTWWLHCVKDASYAQRWVLNAILRGPSLTGDGSDNARTQTVPTDPASILQFFAPTGEAVDFGQWSAGIDPERLEVAISAFERGVAAHFGLSGDDLARTSGTAESGYALTVRREALREQQRLMEGQFRSGDEEFVAKAAALLGLPDEGWTVRYQSLPRSPEEVQREIERIESLRSLGLDPSPQWVLERVEGLDEAGAEALIDRWEQDRKNIRVSEMEREADRLRGQMRTAPNERN